MKKFLSLILSGLLTASLLASLPQAACYADEPDPTPEEIIIVTPDPIDPTAPENPDPEPTIEPHDEMPGPAGDCF